MVTYPLYIGQLLVSVSTAASLSMVEREQHESMGVNTDL